MKSPIYSRRTRSRIRATLLYLLYFLAESHPATAQIDIWIDSGHGGNDPGALGFNGSALPNENELNFAVAGYFENDITSLG